MIYHDSAHGLDRMNGADAYRMRCCVRFNPVEAWAEYHGCLNDDPQLVIRGAEIRINGTDVNSTILANDEKLASSVIGRYRLAEDRFLGPISLIDLNKAIRICEWLDKQGGCADLKLDRLVKQGAFFRIGRFTRIHESMLNAARILGWIRTTQYKAFLSDVWNDEGFFERTTRRRPDSAATSAYGLKAMEQTLICLGLLTDRPTTTSSSTKTRPKRSPSARARRQSSSRTAMSKTH